MGWVKDTTATGTLNLEVTALPVASIDDFRFLDSAGNTIISAKQGAAVTLRVRSKNIGGTGAIAIVVTNNVDGTKVIDVNATKATNEILEGTYSFSMPNANVVFTLTFWHWA